MDLAAQLESAMPNVPQLGRTTCRCAHAEEGIVMMMARGANGNGASRFGVQRLV
jgi:hypothetical protein